MEAREITEGTVSNVRFLSLSLILLLNMRLSFNFDHQMKTLRLEFRITSLKFLNGLILFVILELLFLICLWILMDIVDMA